MDLLVPGFTDISATIQQILYGNLDSYARVLGLCWLLTFAARYAYKSLWAFIEVYFS